MQYYLISTNRMLVESNFVRRWPTHLVLAQFLYDDTETREAVHDLIRIQQAQVILDNGAYEGAFCNPFLYLHLALHLKPWCVVLPDAVNVPNCTSRAVSLDFYEQLVTRGYEGKVMYVPQGTSKEEVLEEFKWVLEYVTNAGFLHEDKWVIGLGKCYLHWGDDEEARTRFLQDVSKLPYFKMQKFHMLGARKVPTKAFTAFNNVIGIDTIKPARQVYEAITGPGRMDHRTIAHLPDELVEASVANFCDAYGLEWPL